MLNPPELSKFSTRMFRLPIDHQQITHEIQKNLKAAESCLPKGCKMHSVLLLLQELPEGT